MRPIDKFILHVVHNLFSLNEYSEGEIKRLMAQFKEEAEDLNIQISDAQLKKYIERFDTLKNSPKVTEKDLRKYSLSKLIKLVTSSPGAELPDEEEPEDDTPDVVYNDNGITIWNGAKQGNCITYGAGERWCITRPGGSYWGQYRYGSQYSYPTFYLAKNSNLPDSDKLSFVSLQTLNNGQYKFTNRENNPGMEGPFSWEQLLSKVPWLRDIPNLKNILKYIPFSKSEKENQVYKENPIDIKQWMKKPFDLKKRYLNIRAGNVHNLFKDISNELFISKYLPQYPQIAAMVAGTAGIIRIQTLMQYLDKFSKQDQLSIAKQIRDKFNLGALKDDTSFDLKKYLVKTDKIALDPEQRLYVTKDNQAIVLLTLGDDIKVGLYTEDDDYPNVKLNKRTAKYLLDYPELDKIPLRNLLKLAEDEVIDKSLITRILDNAKKDPNSAIIIKPVEGGEIILDSNSFSSYKIDDSGKISAVPFNNEEVQQIFSDAKNNESFQQNALNLFKTTDDIPFTIDKEALKNIINSIPYSKRVIQVSSNPPTVVLTADGPTPFFIKWVNPTGPSNYIIPVSKYDEGGRIVTYGGSTNDEMTVSYFNYLRSTNKTFNDNDLLGILRSSVNIESKRVFARNNPPVDANNRYRVVMGQGDRSNDVILINTQNPRESFLLSTARNNLKQFNMPPAAAAQLLGQPAQAPGQAAAQANDAVRAARRGRPPGQANAPRPEPEPVEGGISISTITDREGLTRGFNSLNPNILRRFRMGGLQVPVLNNRGASRRQNLLGANGRVIAAYTFGPSDVYIIRLPNNTKVASVAVQPNNAHFLITPGNAISLNSPTDLLQALQQRNLAEVHRYITNEYFDRNPKHITEFKQILRKHINEKKNGQK